MSLILKGIDLPADAYKISVVMEGKNEEILYRNTVEYEGEALKAVIQIPKGHGAIKDINTFLKNKCLYEYIENDVFNKKYSYSIDVNAIYNAPTILESEE